MPPAPMKYTLFIVVRMIMPLGLQGHFLGYFGYLFVGIG